MISIKMHVAMTVTIAMWSADGAKPPMEPDRKKKKIYWRSGTRRLGRLHQQQVQQLLNRRRQWP
jgi:hypothetical protein